MKKNYEKAKGESSEWRTPKPLIDAIGLEYDLDPCAPTFGVCHVPAKKVFTELDDGLLPSWRGLGLVFENAPWSEEKRAIVPWLRKFFDEADGGIALCVARTSCDWWHQLVLPNAQLICFPTGKTRFLDPDGNPGKSPTNGIALVGKGEIACEALRRSGIGFCVTVDRTAAPPTRAVARKAMPRQEKMQFQTRFRLERSEHEQA